MMKKMVVSSIILTGYFMVGNIHVYANEKEIVYDLEKHQLIETFQIEEGGELVNITVIDISLLYRMADKTYTVSKSKRDSWAISYKVSVNNNKIISAYGGNFTATQGNFSNTSVTKQSDSLVIGKGLWKYRAASNTIQVKTSVFNQQLVIQ